MGAKICEGGEVLHIMELVSLGALTLTLHILFDRLLPQFLSLLAFW